MRPRRAAPCTPSRRHSAPSKRIDPRYATRAEIALSVDVLPAPLGPIMATTSPAATSRSTPRTASTAPYDTDTSRSSSTSGFLFDAEVGVDHTRVCKHDVRRTHCDQLPELEHRDARA